MKKPEVSRFQFINFVVRESRFVFVERGEYEFSFDFAPSGKVYPTLGQFELHLDLKIREKNELVKIDIKTISFFTYEEQEGSLAENKFFTMNAPAIVYPYIRAYIATLTAQSGIGTITMPAMILIPLGERLRKKISIVQ